MSKRLWSYRSGDIKEDLGLMLLAGLGAVAPVHREDDFGVDAVVTLLEPASEFLFPKQSFWVQLKSSGIGEIRFAEHDAEWFRLIDLPLFIGLIDGEGAAISLYSTNLIREHFTVDEKYQTVLIRFGEGVVEEAAPISLKVYLGEPVLRWSVRDVFDAEFRKSAYRVMSKWLEIDGDNVRSRRSGVYWLADWKTGEAPEVGITGFSFASISQDRYRETLRDAEPILVRLMFQMASQGGLATQFPEYMLRVYAENEVACERLKDLMEKVLPKAATRRRSKTPGDDGADD